MIRDNPIAVGLILPNKDEHNGRINWCGTTKIKISATFAASTTSGTATFKIIHISL